MYLIRAILRKSQIGLFDHHIAYVRKNKSGTISQIKAKGVQPVEQAAFDFSAPKVEPPKPTPPPEPEKPKGLALQDGDDHETFIANGKALFDHITGFNREEWLGEKLKINRAIGTLQNKLAEMEKREVAEVMPMRAKIKEENPEMKDFWNHPEYVALTEKWRNDPEKKLLQKKLGELGDKSRAHNKTFEEMRQKVLDHFSQDAPLDTCKKRAGVIGSELKKTQQKQMAEFFSVAGLKITDSTLYYAEQLPRGARANASMHDKCIRIAEDDNAKTVWHECAHHIEYSHHEVYKAAKAFRYERAKKDKSNYPIIKPLKELVKWSSYRDDERAVQDKFIEHYTGKIYNTEATEIVSMGMGMMAMAGDFRKAVEKDPEHLHFIIGMLHHINPKKTS